MRPYIGFKSKGRWANFWGDKVPSKMKKIFKKTARRQLKINNRQFNYDK